MEWQEWLFEALNTETGFEKPEEGGKVVLSVYFLLNHSFIRKLVKTGLFSQSIKTEMQGIPTIAGSFKCTWSCQQFFH